VSLCEPDSQSSCIESAVISHLLPRGEEWLPKDCEWHSAGGDLIPAETQSDFRRVESNFRSAASDFSGLDTRFGPVDECLPEVCEWILQACE